jgi:hypothetical protein
VVDVPRSDILFGPKAFTKDEQELAVAEHFLGLYAPHVESSAIQHGPCQTPTPPDWIFRFSQCAIGVEITEVDQWYSLRFQEREFTDCIYAAFHEAGFDFDLDGLWINVFRPQDALAAASGRTMGKAARQLVELVKCSIGTVGELRPLLFGRHVQVNSSTYPSLAKLASSVDLSLGPSQDPRRSDGRAAPMVIMAGGRLIDEEAGIAWYAGRLRAKSHGRLRLDPPTSWSRADHTILLFHDHPRGMVYKGFGDLTEFLLREAVTRCPVEASSFDEILLLTYRRLEFELLQISGTRRKA